MLRLKNSLTYSRRTEATNSRRSKLLAAEPNFQTQHLVVRLIEDSDRKTSDSSQIMSTDPLKVIPSTYTPPTGSNSPLAPITPAARLPVELPGLPHPDGTGSNDSPGY